MVTSKPGRPAKSRVLDVYMNGELVGQWRHAGMQESFRYSESWLTNDLRRPLSMSLPLTSGSDWVSNASVSNFFANLLPDNQTILNRVASRYRAPSTRPFDILEQIGRDCVGAVQLVKEGDAPPNHRVITGDALTPDGIGRLLDRAIAPPNVAFLEDGDEFRISIAGAQEKTAILSHNGQWLQPRGVTPTTHILKLPLGTIANGAVDFSTSVENEWLCLALARACGFNAAKATIDNFGRHQVLVVERFDRRLIDEDTPWIARLPQEDFCQAKSVAPGLKYEADGGPGMASILDTLRGSESPRCDRAGFLAAQLLFWLLAAPDGHAKNFSLFLQRDGAYRLTPLYDVMSAWPVIGTRAGQFDYKKLKLAMALRSEKNAHYKMSEIQPRHWLEFAERNAISGFSSVAERLIARVPVAIEMVARDMPNGFPAQVSDSIFEGVRSQLRKLQQIGLAATTSPDGLGVPAGDNQAFLSPILAGPPEPAVAATPRISKRSMRP